MTIKKHPRAIPLTYDQENEIRHMIFHDEADPAEVAQKFGVGIARLRRVCCGSFGLKRGRPVLARKEGK